MNQPLTQSPARQATSSSKKGRVIPFPQQEGDRRGDPTVAPSGQNAEKPKNITDFSQLLGQVDERHRQQGRNSLESDDEKDTAEQQRKIERRSRLQTITQESAAVFSQEKQRTTQEIEITRQQLQILIAQRRTDTTVRMSDPVQSADTNLVDPGVAGKYFKQFFDHLKDVVASMFKKMDSSKALQAQQTKTAKKRKGPNAGVREGGATESRAVHDMIDNSEINVAQGA